MPRLRLVPRTRFREEDCACGGALTALDADPNDWLRAVSQHNLTVRHREWLRRLAASQEVVPATD